VLNSSCFPIVLEALDISNDEYMLLALYEAMDSICDEFFLFSFWF
jgi:hypothetical protein